MASIKFDGTEILNTTYIPRFVKHESAPERDLSLVDLAGEDGSVLVAEKYGIKRIVLRGYLTATTQALLETAIDNFKELFSRKEKNLDISWEAGTRRYVATCVSHEFDRDHFHLLFVPWTTEFIVPSGIGKETTETTYIDTNAFTTVSKVDAWTLAGSAKPKPRFLFWNTVPSVYSKGFSLENTDNGERIVVARAAGFDTNKVFIIDCDKKIVTYDGIERGFFGKFPSFKVGVNNIEIVVGNVVDQQFDPDLVAGYYGIQTTTYQAQLFTVPYTDDTYNNIGLYIGKTGTPTNLQAEIWEDTDGAADSTKKVANATFTTDQGNIDNVASWKYINSPAAFTLIGGKKYWKVVFTAGGDGSNYYSWGYANGVYATYKRGYASGSADSGATWADQTDKDFGFKLRYCGISDDAAERKYRYSVYYYKRYL